jgi:hypothetical protein
MSPYAVIVTGFAVLLGVAVAVEILARAGCAPLRPAGEALAAALAYRAGRWAVMGGWLWLGFHFLAR